jgi:hypothetical protein
MLNIEVGSDSENVVVLNGTTGSLGVTDTAAQAVSFDS